MSLFGEVQQVFGGLFTQYFLTHIWTCCTSGLLQFNGSHLGSCLGGICWAQTDVFHPTTLIIWIMKERSCFLNPLNHTESSLCFLVSDVCRTSLVTLSRHSSLEHTSGLVPGLLYKVLLTCTLLRVFHYSKEYKWRSLHVVIIDRLPCSLIEKGAGSRSL